VLSGPRADIDRQFGELRGEMRALRIEASVENAFREQRRLFLIGWAVLLASDVALWFHWA
jgi:hypothetical protein